MKASTFQLLVRLRDKYGPRLFGKIAQKFLALALYDAGFSHVDEKEVQGVDVVAARGEEERYAFEVKTTSGDSVVLSKENLDDLRQRAADGYVPVIAALRVQMFAGGLFAEIPLGQMRPGSIPFSRLRAYRLKDVEALVCPRFEAAVNQHFDGVLARGEGYLNEVLEQRRREQA